MRLHHWLGAKTPRVPRGQHVVTKFPVLTAGSVPTFDPQTWRLKIFGMMDQEYSCAYEELTSGELFPVSTVEADFHCVTSWSKLDNRWEGVKIVDLLSGLTIPSAARYVMVHCTYGYTTNLPIADFKRDSVLLAWRHNGTDLSPEHGYPLRLVVPHLYGWKSAKWVCGVEFLVEDAPGYWERRGYHMYGDPWLEQRYAWD